MTRQTDDKEVLKKLLKEFKARNIAEALDELRYDDMPKGKILGVKGEECAPGQEGCVGLDEHAENLEAVWGEPNFLAAHFLTEGAQIQKAIAMVTLKVSKGINLPAGSGWGTGFMVSNSLFMTNNHVIPNDSFCDDVNMQFMYQNNYGSEPAFSPEFFETNENSFFHTNSSLDYTIVRLKRKPYRRAFDFPANVARTSDDLRFGNSRRLDIADDERAEGLEDIRDFIATNRPISGFDASRIMRILGYYPGWKFGFIQLRPTISYEIGELLNIIQHPKGRKKEVVVQENELVDVHPNLIHYKSDTDYGSSGSPVFNNTWDLMVLHHARDVAEQANEGIRIDKIVADLRNQFQSSNPGLLTELGI